MSRSNLQRKHTGLSETRKSLLLSIGRRLLGVLFVASRK